MAENLVGNVSSDIRSMLGCMTILGVPISACFLGLYLFRPPTPQEATRTPIPSSTSVRTPLAPLAPASTPNPQADMKCVTIGHGGTAWRANQELGDPLADGRLYYDPMGISPMSKIKKLPDPVYAGDLLCIGPKTSNPASLTHQERKQLKVLGYRTRPPKSM